MDSTLSDFDISYLGSLSGFPSNMDIGMVGGIDGMGYEQSFDVPDPGTIIIGIR
jgi:hypothetical protein